MKNDKYLYIFVHLPRTAGTTFVNHIEKNIPEEERLRLYLDTLKYVKGKRISFNYSDYQKIVGNYIKKISKHRDLAKIRIIYGHIVPYGIHQYFKKKPRYFTFVRNPIERAVSLYNFKYSAYSSETKSGKKKDLYRYSFLVNGKVPEFKKWINAKINDNNYAAQDMLMTRFFTSFGYMESEDNADSLRKTFRHFYFIGLTKHFDADSLYLYHQLGINKFFVKRNVSIKHYCITDEETKDFLIKKYSQDSKIFKMAEQVRKEKIKKIKNFKKIVRLTKLRKVLLTPFTQMVFDCRYSLRCISYFLKTKSCLYLRLTKAVKKMLRIKKVF